MPGYQWFDVFMRMLAVVLASLSVLVLSLFDATSNDLLAAIPFLWSFAWALETVGSDRPRKLSARNAVLLSGLFAGISVACKLSNGPLAILLPGLWMLSAPTLKTKVLNTVTGGVATVAGFLLHMAIGAGSFGFILATRSTRFMTPGLPLCVSCWAGNHDPFFA